MADLTVTSDVDSIMSAANYAAIRALLGLDQICDAYLSSTGATNTITASTARNLFENATIADAGLTDADWLVDNSAGKKRFTWLGSETRTFLVNATISFTAADNNIVGYLYVAKNGTIDTDTKIDRKISTGSDVGALSVQGTFSLATNDHVAIFCDINTGTSTLTAQTANISVRPIS